MENQDTKIATLPTENRNFNKGKNNTILFLVLLFISLFGVGYLTFRLNKVSKQNIELKSLAVQLAIDKAEQKAENKNLPTPFVEGVAYSNLKQGFAFNYPRGWLLDDKNADRDLNATLSLTKDGAVIQIYANMDGLGGAGIDYRGTPVTLSGLSLYKYEKENTFAKTKIIGITDDLTQSLGVFNYKGKTYSIFITYPSTGLNETEVQLLGYDYIHVITSFKFIQ